MVDKTVNLSTSYENHYENNEEELKDKVLTDRWQAKGVRSGVIAKEDAKKKVSYENAHEALLINNDTNEVLVSQNVFDRTYPASTTKIMTALLALENLDLKDEVTIKHDITFDDSAAVSMKLKKGDKISVESLLNALIVMSANDAAVALAEAVAGSEDKFVDMMNERAKELGATGTHFANPHGLHEKDHYTTAYDLYLIFKEVTKHNEYFDIASKANSYIEYTGASGQLKAYDMSSTDEYLTGEYALPSKISFVGGKTGTTTEAGACLVLMTEIDAKGLNIREATYHPKATETIDTILDIVKTLVDKGYAYAQNGDVYFRTRHFKEYGKLSHMPIEDLEAGARIDVSQQKEDPLDFVLWKGAKPGEPSWESPWGPGRPGWHIECTAMIRKYLGETIDIHCGGQDLIFPHHENEIAQGECCTGKPYAHYWMHNGYINVDNKKMSKSLGNFFTTREVANQFGYEPIKFMMLQAHYRSPINYSLDVIHQCQASLERLYNCRDNLDFEIKNAGDEKAADEEEQIKKLDIRRQQFIDAMDDDLNTADAIAAIFELVKDINTAIVGNCTYSKEYLEKAMELFDELTDVLGIVYNRRTENIDVQIESLIEQRQQARQYKNFALADKIRDDLRKMGIILEDTPNGVKWRRENDA